MSEAVKAIQDTFAGDLGTRKRRTSIVDYITVLKPRETLLLAFIGVCSAIIAGQGSLELEVILLALITITLGSAGANGLTNYLDRHVDARMRRTHLRVLPAGRIKPASRALIWSLFLVAVALLLAWFLDPLCFVFGLTGTVAAAVFRKKVMCVVQGGIAGCAPVLIGYVAVSQELNLTVLFLCILIAIWIPLHVWSVMIANSEDYRQAGVIYFPISWQVRDAIKVLMALSALLYGASIALWWAGDLGWLYFIVANILGIIMVNASFNLIRSGLSIDAWKIYKLSAFPYLGIIFTVLSLNYWV